ncbi:GH92 family glycosyl hydrolase [Flavobacterium pectinovorum]|uniref:Glycoside hydrolase family 92 protein n=1 Tax=Flavobacterium pectinovorum TaxID=29533 RepID=A0A502EEM6_9FLAO|nr:GH92 family glycosyl hydrolase [Flavobacterium pectinovorum]TPG36165.1 glycoside hydrolase family 92 protein [Flavobacterium pectinovorum]
MFSIKKKSHKTACIFCMLFFSISIFAQQSPVDYVNPFIGTSNFGATFPGPIAPRGMASISPFNVAGVKNTPMEKDSQWLSNPYVNENNFLTGFSQVNLSGVGCPELGVILLMPTTGKVEIDHLKYGSNYSNEIAKAAFYSVNIDKYKVKGEFTASTRVGVSRFTFPKGQSNILLNLGLGLTNEEGAMIKVVSSTEIEGMKSVGSFCYNSPEDAYPVYFVAKFSKPANKFGVWKKTAKYNGTEAQWMGYNGKTRMMENTIKTVVGDSIGSYFTYKFEKQETVEVKVGISYVSIENARENLEKETGKKSFDDVYKETYNEWNEELSKIMVEGGSNDDRTIFYTALYHTLIHPNILNDFNGQYPEIKRTKIGKTDGTRYTVFSLWDTYRNMHPLTSLVYPKQQSDMIKSMLEMYDENGWLPKWELNSTETFTMVGDPASIVIVDACLKGIQDFDIYRAYYAMLKGADKTEDNPLRPGLKEYIEKGYLSTNYSGPVSTTLEYNTSDYAISLLAKALGEKDDYKRFAKRSLSYQKLYDKDLKLLRPRTANGKWYEPFDPEAGSNFQANVGFIEGNAWQYAFMVPHDMRGYIKLMGGDKVFSEQLQKVFDLKQFDMANEPDIAYPYLFNYVKGQEWKSQEMVKKLVQEYFQNKPKGLPGNDDTGTMSAWLVYSMMGIYPISPGDPIYTITTPMFHRITIKLDPRYYKKESIVIERQENNDGKINSIEIDGKSLNSFFISHEDFVNGTKLKVIQN